MKISTWNINSIKARLHIIHDWLKNEKPDVVLLQEIKTQEESFPFWVFEEAGYSCAALGQKSYNGVAIASRFRMEEVTKNMDHFEDPQARYIEALIDEKVRIGSVYIPNGAGMSSRDTSPNNTKFMYKLDFLKSLRTHISTLLNNGETLILGGDFNIAFHDEDMTNPKKWQGSILCTPQERELYQSAFFDQGLVDVLREKIPHGSVNDQLMTWWDYRAGSYQRNDGLRIDHILCSSNLKDKILNVGIDRYTRELEKPSDHAPFWCEFDI
jgi:exodeoxyribonuclease-3